MSQLISRILLTIFMLPLAAIVYTAVFATGERLNLFGYPYRELKGFCGSGTAVWVLIAAYWLLLWGRSVRWNARRIHRTWLGAILSVSVAAIIGGALYLVTDSDGLAAFITSAFAPLFWLVITVFVWRESRDERAERLAAASDDALVCPCCGYNLTGLSAAQCPECGAKFTLNELIAAQPSREVSKADQQLIT